MIAKKRLNKSIKRMILFSLFLATSFLQGNDFEKIVFLTNNSCIYEQPDKNSKCIRNIKKGEELTAIQSNLENKSEDSTQYWNKIQDKNQIFFFPTENPTEAKQFVSFHGNFYPKNQFVHASGLNVRKIPDLSGEIILLIGNGEKVTLLSKSKQKFMINGIEDYWAKIETKTKKIGYVFAAYLSDEEVIQGEDLEFDYSGKSIIGFIKFRKLSINTYRVPGLLQGYKNSEYCGDKKVYFEDKNFDLNKISPYEKNEENRYANVTKSKKVIDKEYFLVNWLDNDSFDGGTIQNCNSFWIKKDEVEFFPISFYQWQRENYGSKFEDTFLDYIEKKNIHLKKSKLSLIKTADQSTKFYVFEKYYYSDRFSTNRDHGFNIISKENGKFEALFESHDFDSISLHDFNNDGNDEILVVDQFSELVKTSIFQIIENKLKEILVMDFKTYEDKNCIIDATLQTKVIKIERKVKSTVEKNNIPCSPIFEKDSVKVNQTQNSFKIENGFVTPLK
ncbi:SH3 domain-containing protein [Leptospira meyeri]|uniref:SH3 domain-containing protein n=1 Tax=Leptospira meyeri TaxID=29508 RepID=UPI001084358D|nr:SH3 domain-containing protein [Leptospira meyeri]TGM62949.1 SH3 domain-containing protein [Leptospira meyeri]TGM73539.1 SH3 domain-containing protein [Leptospira meyeri]